MFSDPTFWVAVGFVVFVAVLIYLRAHAVITKALDERSARIRSELDQAQKLREDAQALFADYQRKQRDALKEAEEIVALARAEAERVTADAKAELENALTRRRQLAEAKIAQAEAQALKDVREAAVDLGIAAARTLMTDALQGAQSDALMDQAIRDVRKRMH